LKRLIYILPVAGFAVIAILLFKSLILPPPDILPSALIDKLAPAVALPPMDNATPTFGSADLKAGHVSVVNFFASWCVPCHMEAPQMMALSKTPGIALYGINYEEHQVGAGRAFLNDLGNPFGSIAVDADGREGIEWGVDAVPETFVVDGKGIIRFKWVGPLTDETIAQQLLPAIEKAKLAS
jgi:cytochrome c biogenesis protein CcmG, thiol:disulfide interchange protein DsbE